MHKHKESSELTSRVNSLEPYEDLRGSTLANITSQLKMKQKQKKFQIFCKHHITLFGWNQPVIFFSRTKSATVTGTNQPVALFSHNKLVPATSRSQPKRVKCEAPQM